MIFPFQPSDVAPFTFLPVLDGTTFTCSVTWNIFGERYYINLYQQTGELVYCCPLIGSPQGRPIPLLPVKNPLTGREWVSSMWFVEDEQTFVVTP